MTSSELESEDESEGESEASWRERFAVWLNRVQFTTYTVLVVGLLLLGFLWHRMFMIVPPGYRGVLYRTIAGGTVTNRIWGEGLHVILPWNKLTIYDITLQQTAIRFSVLSEEGLSLGVHVSVRYSLREEMLGLLQSEIGVGVYERLIKPEIEAHIRSTFGNRPAHEIYSSAHDVLKALQQVPTLGRIEGSPATASEPYVIVQELKLISIELPKVVEAAIAEKYRQEQLMLEYRYKLEREEKEAARKRTEAAGIRDYNLIVGRISPDVLRWRGVDGALELAKSPNSKVVVLGGSQGGMPMILNLGDGPSGSPALPASSALTPGAAAAAAPAAAKQVPAHR